MCGIMGFLSDGRPETMPLREQPSASGGQQSAVRELLSSSAAAEGVAARMSVPVFRDSAIEPLTTHPCQRAIWSWR